MTLQIRVTSRVRVEVTVMFSAIMLVLLASQQGLFAHSRVLVTDMTDMTDMTDTDMTDMTDIHIAGFSTGPIRALVCTRK